MPSKKGGDQASKKAVQKKKQQIVEDKTFGLKNKNKSKKVQQQVASITKNVMNSGDPKMRKLEEERAKAKAERKARAKAAKEEQEALFGAALMAVQKKSTLNKKDGKIEAQGRDANDGADNKKNTSRAMKMMYQMDAQEMSDKLKEDVREDGDWVQCGSSLGVPAYEFFFCTCSLINVCIGFCLAFTKYRFLSLPNPPLDNIR